MIFTDYRAGVSYGEIMYYPWTTEKQVERAIREAILEAEPRAWSLKVHGGPYQDVGVPDLLFCIEGRLLAIEVKVRKPGESIHALVRRVTLNQKKQLRELKSAGAVAGVATSPEEALILLESLRERMRDE